ncbi:YceI family protein [Acanthopleuribacter pedis]|uniref:YceI family protein n=1 Tax=Acanthopleuribacter pedis TaxID=442870 RepID=A0A8J7U3P4_9BACT|nr:YceI family protein [Acanthopleuribacter pedis]MBO1317246.1 YceI family protein [Acanthopleuribacter pedis]MBO1318553.1 YceI family protein [Acanthopleuribacter pedis]
MNPLNQRLFVATAFVLFSLPLCAGWKLDDGKVHFFSVKDNIAAVPGTFAVTGGAKDGSFEVVVNLDTLDTALPPRDTNIKTALFEVASFPKMVLKGAFPADQLPKTVGTTAMVDFKAKLHYRGLSPEITFPMLLIRTDAKTVQAVTPRPVAVGMADLGLTGAPLEAMMKLCAHQSILPIAFVSFSGTWQAN